MRMLITQTLLSAWLYQYGCAEGQEDEARESFMRTLAREKSEPTEAMKNGILFEKGVYALAQDPKDMSVFPAWKDGTRLVADVIRGGIVQMKVSRDLWIGRDEYLVYGICDAVKAGQIYDVKFSNTGFNSAELAGKYLESPQHPAYLYCLPEARKFTYLVSDGKELYAETYTRQETPFIGDIVKEFRESLRREGLDDIYRLGWKAG